MITIIAAILLIFLIVLIIARMRTAKKLAAREKYSATADFIDDFGRGLTEMPHSDYNMQMIKELENANLSAAPYISSYNRYNGYINTCGNSLGCDLKRPITVIFNYDPESADYFTWIAAYSKVKSRMQMKYDGTEAAQNVSFTDVYDPTNDMGLFKIRGGVRYKYYGLPTSDDIYVWIMSATDL